MIIRKVYIMNDPSRIMISSSFIKYCADGTLHISDISGTTVDEYYIEALCDFLRGLNDY